MNNEILTAVNSQLFAVWFLIGAALVFWMQAGFAMVEAGFTRAKNTGKKAEKGMKADAEEAKKQEKLHQEELIEARRKEREEQEKRLKGEGAGSEASSFDSVEISPEGKSQVGAAEETAPDGFDTAGAAAIADGTGDMVYDKSGESAQSAAAEGTYVDVSV